MNRIPEVSFCLWTCKRSLLTHGAGSAWADDYRLLRPSEWLLRGQGNAAGDWDLKLLHCPQDSLVWNHCQLLLSRPLPTVYGQVIQQFLECHWNCISEVNSFIFGLFLVQRSRLLGSPEALYKIRKAIMGLKLSNILTSYIFHFSSFNIAIFLERHVAPKPAT